ncbi:hypothetical protein K440DRAFT_642593 [Wilcoxina mikolae CBS 423.85]|nr:hypothetical protein K440DRAFT_642593 [Wilcoxina mikolae CBS 423.85]
MPVEYYPFKEDQSRPHTLSPSAPPPNCHIPSASSVQISFAPPIEEENDSSPEKPDIPDTTPNDVTEVIDEDDMATSSDNESSETAVTSTPISTEASRKRKRAGRPSTPNPTENKLIDGYNAIITCSNYMESDVSIYGKHVPLIVQRAIKWEPDVFQTARNQIVSGMIAMQNVVIWAEKIPGETSYFINERRKREDERRKQSRRE